MDLGRCVTALTIVALVGVGCSDASPTVTTDIPTTGPTTTQLPASSSTSTSSTISTTTVSSTTTATNPPDPACQTEGILAAVDASVVSARLTPGAPWSNDTAVSQFTERTATAAEFAGRLALDCGFLASKIIGVSERLVIAAWTGPRMAWVIQTSESPATPYEREAIVTVIIDETEGEFLDGDTRALWAGTFDSGETFVIGHVDYNLGAAAKDWVAGPRAPFDEEVTLPSEQHGLDVLEAAGMRNIGIAEPPAFESEEGHVQFVSPTGQISVADIGPTGWFDPFQPRYFNGPTRIQTIDGVDVRITEPDPGDPGYAIGAEIGFACAGFVWLLQPPLNGEAEEMLDTAAAVTGTDDCRTG